MLILLVDVAAAAAHRYHPVMVDDVYDCCRSLLGIDVNTASGVHSHVVLQAVMLAEKRHLDRLAEEIYLNKSVEPFLFRQISSANLSRCLFSASMTACSPTCKRTQFAASA